MIIAVCLGVSNCISIGSYESIGPTIQTIFFTLLSINLIDALVLQPYLFSTLQLACYLLSNSLLSLSPRNQISEAGMGKEAIKGLEDMAARIIAAQPPHLQMVLIEDVSRFLATQKGIKHTSQEITAALHQRLAPARTMPASQGFVAREARRETMPEVIR
jgi:hypothetical protein